MFVKFTATSLQICFNWLRTAIESGEDWREEMYCNYMQLFIVHDARGELSGRVGG